MERIGTDNQIDAARHEAGHAVIGYLSGYSPASVHIRLEADSWVGDCVFEKDNFSAEDLTAIAIAGCLAHAKSVAERQFGQVADFDKKATLRELIHILRDQDRTSSASDPGSCDLAFIVGENAASIRFEGSWFSGVDVGKYRMARRLLHPHDSTDVQTIRSVMNKLDEERNWRPVCSVADAICQQPLSADGRLVLGGDSILNNIGRAYGQAHAE